MMEEEEEEPLSSIRSTIVALYCLCACFPPEGTEPLYHHPPLTLLLGLGLPSGLRTSISLPPEAEITFLLLPSSRCPTQIQTLRIASTQALIDAVTAALPSPPLPPLPPSLYTTTYPAEAVPEIAPVTLGEVNTRVTELAELHEHDTHDLMTLQETVMVGGRRRHYSSMRGLALTRLVESRRLIGASDNVDMCMPRDPSPGTPRPAIAAGGTLIQTHHQSETRFRCSRLSSRLR
ncbi:hypothetical protein Tco_0738532 [Tanacetum coccineum]